MTKKKDTTPDLPQIIAPPYWVALRPLPVGQEMGAESLPVRAFSTGDHVPPDHVVNFGWQPYVAPPEGDWSVSEPAGDAAPEQE